MLFLHLHSPFLVSESSYTLVNALQFQKDVLQYISVVYKYHYYSKCLHKLILIYLHVPNVAKYVYLLNLYTSFYSYMIHSLYTYIFDILIRFSMYFQKSAFLSLMGKYKYLFLLYIQTFLCEIHCLLFYY